MNKILLCTVGTSLFVKYRNMPNQIKHLTPLRKESITHLENKNYIGFSKSLLKEDEGSDVLGAEICSIHHMMKGGKIAALDHIIFMVSDTVDGRDTGEVLARYYNDSKFNLSGKKDFAVFEVIEKLDDQDPVLFKNIGLRNLVKTISNHIIRSNKDNIIINATGGYKAQILFAGVVGQSLGIPVYYMFDTFNTIIELPPQPVSFDSNFWIEHQDIFFALEKSGYVGPVSDENSDFNIDWYNSKDARFDSLITSEKEGDRIFIMLSPTGEIFHQMFLSRFHHNDIKLPVPSEKKEAPHVGDHHMPTGIKGISQYLKKLTDHFPFIIKCSTTSLNKTNPTHLFTIGSYKNKPEIFGSYWDSKGFTVNFIIQTTSKNPDEMLKAVIHLNENWKR